MNLFNKQSGTAAPTEKESDSLHENFERKKKVIDLNPDDKQRICLYKPIKLDDAVEIANLIHDNITIVLNLEKTNSDTACRILDFLKGVSYACKGHMYSISSGAFLITPNGVELKSEDDEDCLEDTEKDRAGLL